MFDTDEAVEALCEAAGGQDRPVRALYTGGDGEAGDFTLLPGLDELLGWCAPPDVWATGVLTRGTATLLDGGDTRRQRCQVACVVDRWGSVAGRVRFDDAGTARDTGSIVEAPGEGRMLEVLQRCMGRPTAAPRQSVAFVLVATWMARAGEAAVDAGGPLGWDDLLALMPAGSLLGPGDIRPAEGGLDMLTASMVAALPAWDWDEVRRRWIDRRLSMAGIGPDMAAWMDTGMLCRWMLDDTQPLDMLVRAGLRAVDGADRWKVDRLLTAALEAESAAAAAVPAARTGRGACARRGGLHGR